MPQCLVKCCGNYYGKTRGNAKVIYHMLPSNPVLRGKWIEQCTGKKNNTSVALHARVCSAHFADECYQRDLQHELLGLPLRRKLKAGAFPNRNLTAAGNKLGRAKEKLKPILDPQMKSNNLTNNNKQISVTAVKQKPKPVSSPKEEPKPIVQLIQVKKLAPKQNKLNAIPEPQMKNNVNNNIKLPMRSSIRIAKKKSIEQLPTSPIGNNNKKNQSNKENEMDKLKFMSKLQLKFEENQNVYVEWPPSEFKFSADKLLLRELRKSLDVDEKMPDVDEEIKEEESPVDISIRDVVIEENGFEEKNLKVKDIEAAKDDQPQSPADIIEEVKPDDEPENNEESNNSNTSEESQSNKRKYDDPETPNKRLCREIQENFYARDKIFGEVTEMSNCTTVDQLHNQTEQILAEIRTLNELAKEKEREWNNIIHLKKLKEELLLRIQRRKQVMLLNSGETESADHQQSERVKNGSSILKSNLTNPKKLAQMKNSKQQMGLLQRTPPQYHLETNGSLDGRGQAKQRPVLDVQSIIADYRQRHPETVPRRGRRIRNTQTLGSGSQVHQNIQGLDVGSDLGMLLNISEANQNDNSRPSSAESTSGQGSSEPSFKDMLVQFAKLSKSERNELIQNAIKPPPPYPEVTVHPVPTANSAPPTNSLLHGILTKAPTKSNSKTAFSPTLARLLTTPEKGNGISAPTGPNTLITAGNVSISEILSTSKSRSEITITPVDAQYEAPTIKRKSTKQVLDEEEAEDSADRLVIDESNENHDARGKGDNSSDTGDEVPQCQGCNQKSALFVCAGCGNQWYCSRDCQVSAWDEHSEVCSG